MRVFITGGAGTIGETVIKELRRAASDETLRALGATPHRDVFDHPTSYHYQSAAAASSPPWRIGSSSSAARTPDFDGECAQRQRNM